MLENAVGVAPTRLGHIPGRQLTEEPGDALLAIGGRTSGMNDSSRPPDPVALAAVADRLDELADTADLMDDTAGAELLREQAASRRLAAMALLDR